MGDEGPPQRRACTSMRGGGAQGDGEASRRAKIYATRYCNSHLFMARSSGMLALVRRPGTRTAMARFVTGAALSGAVRSITKDGSADLAVAFWGFEACQRLSLPNASEALRVACDAQSGACNPHALEDLLRRGAQIVDVPGLHAKVYIGRHSVVIASANASANGLAEEAGELNVGLEAGYLSDAAHDVRDARDWFNTVFASGHTVSMGDLPELKELWTVRRNGRPGRASTFLSMMLKKGALLDRRLKVAFYQAEDPPEYLQEIFKTSPFFEPESYRSSGEWPFYWGTEDWDIGVDDLILDFELSHGRPSCGGVWRVQGVLSGGSMLAVRKVERPFQLPFPRRDQSQIARLARAFVADRPSLNDGRLLDGTEFAQAIAGS